MQEEYFHKEEPEEKQLAKEPTKRFSTFLQRPKGPVPKPKPRQDNVEDLPWKRKYLSPTPKSAKQQKLNDTQPSPLSPQQQKQEQEQLPEPPEEVKNNFFIMFLTNVRVYVCLSVGKFSYFFK